MICIDSILSSHWLISGNCSILLDQQGHEHIFRIISMELVTSHLKNDFD